MNGDQPCDFCSSPVSSNILRSSQPTTGVCKPPALVHSVWLASEAKFRWWVGKQVLINVNWPVAGSYLERWRLDSCSGKTCAEGWLDPCLQKSGFCRGAHPRGEPDSALLVHHRVVRGGLAVPTGLRAPIRRRLHCRGFRCRRVRIAHRVLDFGD